MLELWTAFQHLLVFGFTPKLEFPVFPNIRPTLHKRRICRVFLILALTNRFAWWVNFYLTFYFAVWKLSCKLNHCKPCQHERTPVFVYCSHVIPLHFHDMFSCTPSLQCYKGSQPNSLKTISWLGPEWSRAIINVSNYTCAFSCCDKSKLCEKGLYRLLLAPL